MSPTLIDPLQLISLQQSQSVVIDTRAAEAYLAGHIPGAVNVREIFTYLARTDSEGIAELQDTFADLFGKAGLSGREHAILYEDAMNTGFGQSCRGYFLLRSLGYDNVSILHGGYEAWIRAGLPVSTERAPISDGLFPLNPRFEQFMVTQEEMLEAIGKEDIVILDVRDRDEWEGLSSSPYGVDFCPRKGRMPGAVWIEWYRLMQEDKAVPGLPVKFRPKHEILDACREVGIDEDKQVYVYCFKGARASNTFVALQEAGIKNVKIYFGSWNEWSRDSSLPIEEGRMVNVI